MQLIKKPWGQEEILEVNEKYVMKRLTMKGGHRCSLQYHELKRETVYVLSGVLKVDMGATKDKLETKIFRAGDSITLAPFMVHRMEAVEDAVYLEASTPELEDVVRIQDDYKRA
jgi:mannose-6-phosphate isomerase